MRWNFFSKTEFSGHTSETAKSDKLAFCKGFRVRSSDESHRSGRRRSFSALLSRSKMAVNARFAEGTAGNSDGNPLLRKCTSPRCLSTQLPLTALSFLYNELVADMNPAPNYYFFTRGDSSWASSCFCRTSPEKLCTSST